MYELKVILHSEVTSSILNEIIKIKSKSWYYSYDEHLNWINQNLKNNDFHFLLQRDDKIVAYLNLIEIEVVINNVFMRVFGIGNVCASVKGEGMGGELINKTNQFLVSNNKIGMLFCKNELVNFYKKCDWRLVEKSKLIYSFDNDKIETMIFNSHFTIEQIIFKRKPF